MAVQPHDAYMTMYRTLRVGSLGDIHMLDTRQFRTDQPCGDGAKPSCPEREGPSTMMGDVQEKWLRGQLKRGQDSRERWNILAQQIIFSQVDVGRHDQAEYMMDKWDGYPQARRRLVDNIVETGLNNVVILSGDNHNNWVFDVKRNPDDEKSPAIASEFAGTSLTSGGDGTDLAPEFASVLAKNPQVKFHNSQRGYVRCTVTSKTMDKRLSRCSVREQTGCSHFKREPASWSKQDMPEPRRSKRVSSFETSVHFLKISKQLSHSILMERSYCPPITAKI